MQQANRPLNLVPLSKKHKTHTG